MRRKDCRATPPSLPTYTRRTGTSPAPPSSTPTRLAGPPPCRSAITSTARQHGSDRPCDERGLVDERSIRSLLGPALPRDVERLHGSGSQGVPARRIAAAHRDGVDLPGDPDRRPAPRQRSASAWVRATSSSGWAAAVSAMPSSGPSTDPPRKRTATSSSFASRPRRAAPRSSCATNEADPAIRVFAWRRGGMPETRGERCPSRSSEPLLISTRRRGRGA